MHYMVLIVIGVVAGVIAGRVIGGSGDFGVAGDVVFGVIGALCFAYVFVRLQLGPDSGGSGQDVMAAIGAIVGLYFRRVIKLV